MNDESAITDELRALLGVEGEPVSFDVETGQVRRLAEAIGDPNPLWTDAEYARRSRYGAITAPPTFLIDAGIVPLADKLKAANCPLKGFLNGGTEIEYYRPIRVGDTITTRARLVDMREKMGSSGRLLIMLVEITYTNQDGELVRVCRNTFIRR